MRRKEKEIIDIKEIEKIIMNAKVCHLGLAIDNIPYVVIYFVKLNTILTLERKACFMICQAYKMFRTRTTAVGGGVDSPCRSALVDRL